MHNKIKKIWEKFSLFFAVLIASALIIPMSYANGADSIKSSAVQVLKNEYEVNGVQNNDNGLGSHTYYILTQAEVDVSSWKHNGGNFPEELIKAIQDDIIKAGEKSGKLLVQDLAAAQELERKDLVDQLSQILKDRQGENGFGNSVFSNVPAFELIGRAGLTSSINGSQAKDYILGQQNTTNDKDLYSWGFTYGEPLVYYPDFITTAKAVRALHYLDPGKSDAEIQDAINKALNWMGKQQLANGSFVPPGGWSGMDDPLINTSEAIAVLSALDMDLSVWKSSENKSAVDYLTNNTLNSDGSFGKYKNIMDAVWFLDGYSLVDPVADVELSTPAVLEQPNTEAVPADTAIEVSMAVVGKDGEILVSPFSYTVEETNQWGLTVLGSLADSGVDYHTSNWSWGTYVDAVAGMPGGSGGWMFAVNDVSAAVLAECVDTCKIKNGDKILWYYAYGMDDQSPLWSDVVNSANGNGSGGTFKDIANHWAKKEIEAMAAQGYVNGSGENMFSPNEKISRAEFVAILTRMAGLTAKADGKVQFSDVPANAWYRDAVDATVSSGIVNGIDQNNFAPNQPITREQMAKMIEGLMAQKGLNTSMSADDINKVIANITDSSEISSWARIPATLMVKEQLMNGRDNGCFVPGGNTTRAEATVVLYRVLHKNCKTGDGSFFYRERGTVPCLEGRGEYGRHCLSD